MGFRVQLILVQDKTSQEIHRDYKVIPTGKFVDVTDQPVLGATLDSGRYLLFINDEIEPDRYVLREISKNASLLCCYVNETVMVSYVSFWSNGYEEWFVLHDNNQGVQHLEAEGNLPHELQPIQDRLFTMQAQDESGQVDYIFDVPVELFAALGGIRYNQDLKSENPRPWEVLERL
jgi:hypothetical protein